MNITKTETRITVDGKEYGSVEEMPPEVRSTYDGVQEQLANISKGDFFKKEISVEKTKVGSNIDWVWILGLGMVIGAVIMYFSK